MKNLLLVVAFLYSLEGVSQLSLDGGKYVYHKTNRQTGSGEELFDKALGWVSKNIDRNKATVNTSRDELFIIVKGSHEDIKGGTPNKIIYTLKIEFLSGVYRETFTDFYYKSKGKELPYESRKLTGKKSIMNKTYDKVGEMSSDLISYMEMELSVSEK